MSPPRGECRVPAPDAYVVDGTFEVVGTESAEDVEGGSKRRSRVLQELARLNGHAGDVKDAAPTVNNATIELSQSEPTVATTFEIFGTESAEDVEDGSKQNRWDHKRTSSDTCVDYKRHSEDAVPTVHNVTIELPVTDPHRDSDILGTFEVESESDIVDVEVNGTFEVFGVVNGTFEVFGTESAQDVEDGSKQKRWHHTRTHTDTCVDYKRHSDAAPTMHTATIELAESEPHSDSGESGSDIVDVEVEPWRAAAARVKALDKYAARVREAATHARKVANAKAAQQQFPWMQAAPSPNNIRFPDALERAEASAYQFSAATQAAAMTDGQASDCKSLYFKNIPNDYSRDMLCEMLDLEGLVGLYDFVYLPRDFKTNAGFGFAFVNFELHSGAALAIQRLQGFSQWTVPTRKVLDVAWSSALQGLQAHVERYRNSPVMHKHVPEEYKAIVLKNGVRQKFPGPTRRIRPPRPCEDGTFRTFPTHGFPRQAYQ